MILLSPHFTLEELTASQTAARAGIANNPDPAALANLERLCGVLETVRSLLGSVPLLISSGYRCPHLNTLVGGAVYSAHMAGLAADFTCPGFGDPLLVCYALEPHMKRLGIDQLILEYGQWTHLGLAATEPRHMALMVDGNGTRNGFA
jgi:hypothetical protein